MADALGFLSDAPTAMVKPTPQKPFKHLCASDLRAIAQWATQATAGVTRIAEDVHQTL
jgi:hypothetical protein